MRRFSVCILVLAFSVAIATPALPQNQTLPPGLDTVEGNNSSAYPWASTATHIWHWIYDTSNFTATYPILITGLYVRANGGAALTAGTFQNVEVTLSSATVNWNTITATSNFAANMDIDQAVVYNGPVAFPGGTASTPNPWVPILISPWLYDPTAGKDFIIQVRTPGPGNYIAMGAVDVHGAAQATRYGNLTNAYATNATFANLPATPYVPVVKIDFTPASGLYANFTATGTSGPAPRNVNFTDTSFSSTPGGVTSWAWDFNNDTVIDSTLANPSYTYLIPGNYTVSLTVTDGAFPASTNTKTNFVTVGQYVFDAITTGGGAGDLTINAVPTLGALTSAQGFTLVSFTAPPTLGSGPAFGLVPDSIFWGVLTQPAAIGNPLHYIPAPGVYPDVPLYAPAGSLSFLTGVTVDFVQVAFDFGFQLILVSNPDRVTF